MNIEEENGIPQEEKEWKAPEEEVERDESGRRVTRRQDGTILENRTGGYHGTPGYRIRKAEREKQAEEEAGILGKIRGFFIK